MLRVSTRVIVSFHTWRDNGLGGGQEGAFVAGLYRVLGLTTSKSFGEPAGEFQLQLQPEPRSSDDAALMAGSNNLPSLLDMWREPEGVWVKLWFQINGKLFDAMLGNIDTVHEEMIRSEDGTRHVTFTISGRDHGKVFAETELFVNIFERRGAVPEAALYRALSEETQFTPAQITEALIRVWLGNEEVSDTIWQLPQSLYGGQPFYRALNRSTIDPNTRGNGQELTILQPDQQGQKLWDALQNYCNPMLNELWTDLAPDPATSSFGSVGAEKDPVTGEDLAVGMVRDLRPAVYLRERPFISSEFGELKWNRLPTHHLHGDQIAGTSFAKGSSAERFNFWEMVGGSAQTLSFNFVSLVREIQDAYVAGDIGDPGSIPVYDLTSIRRHGLRRFRQSTRYIPINDASISSLVTGMFPRWLRLLHDWYVVAPMEVTGTIHTSYVMPWIRVGHRVKVRLRDGREMVFYVEGVQHSYSYPNSGSTTLTVTRGEAHGRHLLHEVYERIERARASVGEMEDYVPGASHTLTDEQRATIREVTRGSDWFSPTMTESPEERRDPATATDERGTARGGTRLGRQLSEPLGEGDSQHADPSMNFADTAPRQSANAQGVEGIDDENNAPPNPTEALGDPLSNIDDPAGEEIALDQQQLEQTVGTDVADFEDF